MAIRARITTAAMAIRTAIGGFFFSAPAVTGDATGETGAGALSIGAGAAGGVASVLAGGLVGD